MSTSLANRMEGGESLTEYFKENNRVLFKQFQEAKGIIVM